METHGDPDSAADPPPATMSTSKRVAPFVALVALNALAGLAASSFLLCSAALPVAMAIHGSLMIIAWGCLLPLGGLVARYFKVTPTQDFPTVVDNLFWWHSHRILQYSGIAIAAVALIVILRATGGHFDTLHSRFGLTVMIFAGLQVSSPLFRGTKGGPTGVGARLVDESTWRGDHYDMTLRRRLFEAWHKPIGWFVISLAQVTMLLGAQLAGASDWLLALLGLMTGALALAICDSHVHGRWVDTHVAIWGPRAAVESAKARNG